MSGKSVYVIGSLRNKNIPVIASALRDYGLDVFDDWYSAGPEADDYLRDYYRERNFKYSDVLNSHSARHIFEFDKKHLDRCDCAVLVLPAGKSGHLELGYVIGRGKPGYILMDGEPERVDIMHSFATKVFMNQEEMIEHFKSEEQYPRVYGNTIEQPALQSGFWKAPSITYLRGDAPLIADAKCSPQLRGTEVRSPQLEEGSRGKVQGREVSPFVGELYGGWEY